MFNLGGNCDAKAGGSSKFQVKKLGSALQIQGIIIGEILATEATKNTAELERAADDLPLSVERAKLALGLLESQGVDIQSRPILVDVYTRFVGGFHHSKQKDREELTMAVYWALGFRGPSAKVPQTFVNAFLEVYRT